MTWLFLLLRKLAGAVDDAQSIALALGVPLVGYGAHQVYAPAGWLVPGLILLWLGLPTRPFPIVFVRPSSREKA